MTRFRTTAAIRTVLLTGAIAVLPAAPALAQDTESNASSTPNQTVRTEVDGQSVIIVEASRYVPSAEGETATKSDIPLIETPQSVSVITRDQIDLLNFIDAQQAVRYVAGVSGENYGPDLRFDFIQVRGFTPKQFIDGLATPVTTTIFSNGVDLYAFESLDILKGPASVLYGSAPPGGIYNQRSRRPSSEFGGEVSVKYGEDDYKQIAMTATGAASSMIDGRITFLARDRGATRDGVDAQRILFAPSLTVHLGPDTEFTPMFYYQYDEVNGDTNGLLPAQGTLLDNPNGEIDRGTNLGEPDINKYRRDQYGVGFEFAHDFSENVGLDVNLKYSEYDEDHTVIYGSGLAEDLRTVFRSSFPYVEDVESLAVDTRLNAKLFTGGIEHTFLVGVDYRDVTNFAGYGFASADPIDLYDPVYNELDYTPTPITTLYNDQKLKQTGIYAQDQLRMGNFYLLASGRYDWVDTDYRAPFVGIDADTPFLNEKQGKFTYRIGANYVSESGIAPYISYATSFEPLLGTDFVTEEAFNPSEGEQIEAGIKFDGRAFGDDVKIFATAAVFDITQKNVVTTGGGTLPMFGTQSGEVEVQGGEIEVVARIRNQLSINGSYSYTDSEIKESNVEDEIGEPLPVTPKHKVSLLVDYTFQVGALAGLGFGVGGRYTSSSAGSLPGFFNPIVLDSEDPVLFDAIVHYDTPGWRFAINGSNVFDKKYVARCASFTNCTFGASRQVIGTITRKF
ncbi:TonB-dependent siderophore receptor [Croceicoccus naphthovorans]|uniref:Membrane protein n=1 Tax=Croceicoccus naphthovorans TaxID=1348774 RepID=A0A0G3XFR2_9SPHN|nr:TonB-dependent siderophore receptor [Croceicoccus naphthovorans]AKM09481.1 membrane protein [Croceicoccus naphthovorans]MBB3991509.1 iron complex outermembrane receptor protein [Croceicoccus naphthovorans]